MNGAGSELNEPQVIRGRRITAEDVQAVRQLLVEQPRAGRIDLARGLCVHWQWQASSGRWKVRSAQAILSELERRGLMSLPAAERSPVPRASPVAGLLAERTVEGVLSQCRPLRWELVGTPGQRRGWRQLLERYHYLGAPSLVGANLKYLVYGRAGEPLGALGWQSAVQNLGCRDRLLGWDAAQRAGGLEHLINGVGFLVLAQRLSEENQSLTKSMRMKEILESWKPSSRPSAS